MKTKLIAAAVLLSGAVLGARVTDIYGLAPFEWQQKGKTIPLTVYDATTSPEWPAVVTEAVGLWNQQPFQLSYTKVDRSAIPLEAYDKAILIIDNDVVPFGGRTFIRIDNRQRSQGATVEVLKAASYNYDTPIFDGDDWLYNMRKVMRHELGNALGVGELDPHGRPGVDPNCVMYDGVGIEAGTAFDFGLLCQRYGCR